MVKPVKQDKYYRKQFCSSKCATYNKTMFFRCFEVFSPEIDKKKTSCTSKRKKLRIDLNFFSSRSSKRKDICLMEKNFFNQIVKRAKYYQKQFFRWKLKKLIFKSKK